jgi:hypothetical protein
MTVKVRCAMVNVSCLCFDVLVETLKVTVPLPVPLAGDVIVSQEVESTLAVQPQPESLAAMVTEYEPAVFATVWPVAGLRVKVHPLACVTVAVWPAMVIVPLRIGPAFAATTKFTLPLPVPVGVTPVIQAALLAALHPQEKAAEMVTLSGPPPAPLD